MFKLEYLTILINQTHKEIEKQTQIFTSNNVMHPKFSLFNLCNKNQGDKKLRIFIKVHKKGSNGLAQHLEFIYQMFNASYQIWYNIKLFQIYDIVKRTIWIYLLSGLFLLSIWFSHSHILSFRMLFDFVLFTRSFIFPFVQRSSVVILCWLWIQGPFFLLWFLLLFMFLLLLRTFWCCIGFIHRCILTILGCFCGLWGWLSLR